MLHVLHNGFTFPAVIKQSHMLRTTVNNHDILHFDLELESSSLAFVFHVTSCDVISWICYSGGYSIKF